jgi:hypothetical protein
MIHLHINKYTERAKSIFNAQTKSVDYLHIIVLYDSNIETIYWAVYVWDTREVMEYGSIKINDVDENVSLYLTYVFPFSTRLQNIQHTYSNIDKAFDNHSILLNDWQSMIVDEINKYIVKLVDSDSVLLIK